MMSDFVAIGPSGEVPSRHRAPRAARRERLTVHFAGTAALATVLITGDAFGSDDLSLARRLLMFGVVSSLLVGQSSLLADLARRHLRGPAVASVAAIAATLALMTIEIHLLKATPIVPYAPDPLPAFSLFLAPFVIPVSALVLALKWAARPRPRGQRAPAPRPAAREAGAAQPAMPDGWPRADILRLRADDHYLQLWTTNGSMLVRARLRDALARLPADGLRPHRSWWVARSQVGRIERVGRDHVMILADGERIPVARSRAVEIRQALAQDRRD